ncbi:protein CURVATURE THYLAKOID 1A, chloroplastic-like isoform X1 [Miscanthus floridulus]|uniref:protein CURVATURE THYLAKOID 1A, chloroplastic-like isoform X1 n=1 Tax=Miscanthus floridulus TaxID=154761 RepID=UPI003459FD5C
MVAAAAAVRPVSLRRLGALLRAPVPCGLTTSRVAAPFPSRIADSMKISQLQLTATRFSKENNFDEDDELLSELRDKWDATENKSSLALYGAGAILTVWISLVVVKSLDSVPLLPGLLELVGLSYSGWFVYRYLLFQENRKELTELIDDIKRRIIGNDD